MRLLAISFLFLSLGAFSQKKEFFQIDSLPKAGILLEKGWKWHAGDNLDFAEADFDDSKWEDINPILTIPELPNIDTRQPLWLRIKFNATSQKNVAFSIKQSSASEIYLNGKLVKKYGRIGQSGNGTIAYVPFDEYLISNLDSLSNTLSIRIFFQEGIRYKQFQDIFYPLFTCQIHSISQLPKYPHIDAYISEGFNIGFPLILFLVYFTIFLFYKPNKSNLWFSLWGASISLTAFLSLLSKLTTLISLQNSYTSWASIFSSFGTICLIFSIYLLLNQKRIWTIIGFIILVTISTVNYFLPNNSDPRIFDFVILLFYIGLIVYMSLNAIKSGNEGGKYVIIGIVFFIVFWTIFLFDLLGFNKSTLIAAVNYHIAALSLPIIVATLLGLEFRNTNKSLLKNLEDIKKLSAEKQEILTTQNETLEKQVTERTAELVHKNRDLEIEGALEKIRSTSLAMRHSDEIKNVVTVLFEKLKELNLVFDAAAIHVFREGNKNASIWVASPEQLSSATEISLPYDADAFENNPIILDVWNAKESGCHIFNKIYPFELKNRYFNYVFKHNDYEKVPEFVRNIILNAECYTATFVSEKNSLLGVNSWTKQLFSPTDFEILKRVARVFEQAYTRFLDLQKAEAQAREAQVEVALEKIRSRSLAMHHSNELNDVIAIMLDKLKELNVLLGTVALQFFDEKTKNSFLLIGSDLNEKPQMIYLPYDEKILNEDTYLKDSWKAKTSGESIINKKYSLEQKNKYFEYVFANNDLTVVPQPVRDFILQTQSHITCLLIEKNSALFVDSWDGQVYNEEMLKVLKRASIVFEQAYVRFLDLQKAEAQAREAQIEAALERVRSRTMAMQKSDELGDASLLLDSQIRALGIKTRGCGFNIYGENESTEWFSSEMGTMPTYKTPRENIFLNYYEAGQRGETLLINKFTTEECISHYEYLCSLPGTGEGLRQFIASGGTFPTQQIDHVAYFKYGYLLFITLESVPEANDIFKRFAKVFEQTYTRFLDLQKAEAQAREAQIEIALERVRSKTMAMQHSNQLREIAATTLEQLQSLGFTYGACSIVIMDAISGDMIWWISGFENHYPESYRNTYFEHPFYLEQLNNWKEGKKYAVMVCEGEAKKAYDEYVFSKTEFVKIPEDLQKIMQSFEKITFSNAYMKHGALSWSTEPLDDEYAKILQRFAGVFEQSYTRFLDLQKAEAQAREAQIEAALERVRSRTMAMRHSSELSETATVMYGQLKQLGAELWTCGFALCEEDNIMVDKWMGSPITGHEFNRFIIPYTANDGEQNMYDTWKNGSEIYTYVQEGEELKAIYAHLMTVPSFRENYKGLLESGISFPVWQKFYIATYKYGYLMTITTKPFDEEQVFVRFANVFEQTYTRFLDLQKAEAQAREAQIEAGLEKVRSKSLAMQKSEELYSVINVIADQLYQLDFKLDSASFFLNQDSKDFDFWVNARGESNPNKIIVPKLDNPVINRIKDAQENGQTFFVDTLTLEEKNEWFQHVFESPIGSQIPEERKKYLLNTTGYARSVVLMKQIGLFIVNFIPLPYSEEENAILRRFAYAFEQAYVRFLDLQKAEKQAREAQIEVALERVRARAMAMQKSDELADAARILYHEFGKLGIKTLSCGYMFIDENMQNQTAWVTLPDGTILSDFIDFPLTGDQVLDKRYESWKAKKPLHSHTIQGKANKKHHQFLSEHVPESVSNDIFAHIPESITFYSANFSSGYLLILAPSVLSADEEQIIIRFAKVFELTYTRFTDLKQAEAQTREAQIEASFERIRASALAMQTSDEFLGVVQTLYEQINALGQKELEATIIQFYDIEQGFINSWNAQNIDKASAGNISFGTAHIPFDACRLTLEWLKAYQSTQEDYTIIAKGEILKEWLLLLLKISPEIKDRMGDTLPETSYFHYSKFSAGALSMVSTKPFEEESKYLLKRAASAFDLAYKRYLDLQLKEEQAIKLADEKQRLEAALKELQATQAQLIQKEKLASLGELTAGIAHEIQNPLNFVNNFSELSEELIDEMNDELSNGKTEEVIAIAADLKLNIEKIHHHGKRASGIVKAMLEHSRTSTGQKEPTDINVLADEYLRLSFHGLRAKDKTFNSDFKTDLESNLPLIEAVPQDLGRVFLNLINNAFYACDERTKKNMEIGDSNSYKPLVIVSTNKIGEYIEVRVNDNGSGISPENLSKIFQPFFTTKPTGKGTGLGLSLSYDIITIGHGGTLVVESNQEIGTTFIVKLPIN